MADLAQIKRKMFYILGREISKRNLEIKLQDLWDNEYDSFPSHKFLFENYQEKMIQKYSAVYGKCINLILGYKN